MVRGAPLGGSWAPGNSGPRVSRSLFSSARPPSPRCAGPRTRFHFPASAWGPHLRILQEYKFQYRLRSLGAPTVTEGSTRSAAPEQPTPPARVGGEGCPSEWPSAGQAVALGGSPRTQQARPRYFVQNDCAPSGRVPRRRDDEGLPRAAAKAAFRTH